MKRRLVRLGSTVFDCTWCGKHFVVFDWVRVLVIVAGAPVLLANGWPLAVKGWWAGGTVVEGVVGLLACIAAVVLGFQHVANIYLRYQSRPARASM